MKPREWESIARSAATASPFKLRKDVVRLAKTLRQVWNLMVKREKQIHDDPDDKRRWLVFMQKCRVCSYRAVGTAPEGTDLDALECGKCGNMTSEALERRRRG